MNFKSYLKTRFPLLKINKPLFYNWNYGLRFELGRAEVNVWKNESLLNKEYFNEALQRAINIIEESFDKNDNVFFVCQKYSKGRQKINKNHYCFKNIKSFHNIEHFKIKNPYDENDFKKEHFHRVVFHTSFDQINYYNILKRAIYSDFGGNSIETYFINKDKNIIFHVYDDRGLDILSQDKYTLKDIYDRFNNWLLEYDIKKMDATFKNL